jgi:tRNA (cytidine56-2'-O)-methyltransferase
MDITVLRLGHRPLRDKRLTTHLLLCARALGAGNAIYSGERDRKLEETIEEVVDQWGGNFRLKYTGNYRKAIREWEGKKIHLTMYGYPVEKAVKEIQNYDKPLLIIVGGPKVPADIYELSDWNISVTTQPHSEVSALAIFLHLLLEGRALIRDFPDAKIKITPARDGKDVEYLS